MGAEVRPGDSRAFTLARHNDIHQEYMQEFRRLKTSLQAAGDKAQLLGLSRPGNASDHLALEVTGGSSALLLRSVEPSLRRARRDRCTGVRNLFFHFY